MTRGLLQLVLALLVLAKPAAAAIARDTGASTFPVTQAIFDTAGTSRNLTAFSTSAATTTLIVYFAWRGNANVALPYTVTWVGGTPSGATAWTRAIEQGITGTGANVIGCAVWTASATSALTSVQVNVAKSGADESSNEATFAQDALTGAGTSITNTGQVHSNNGSAVNRAVTLAGVASGSWLYVSYSGDDSGANLTAQTNTTTNIENRQMAAGGQAASGANITGTSGSITVGWTGTQAFSATCAAEVPVAGGAAADIQTMRGFWGAMPKWQILRRKPLIMDLFERRRQAQRIRWFV